MLLTTISGQDQHCYPFLLKIHVYNWNAIRKYRPNSRIKHRVYVRLSTMYECMKKLHFISRNWRKEN